MPPLGLHSQNVKSSWSERKAKAPPEVSIAICHPRVWPDLRGVAVLEKMLSPLVHVSEQFPVA